MKNREIEAKLSSAFEKATPDVLDRILGDLDDRPSAAPESAPLSGEAPVTPIRPVSSLGPLRRHVRLIAGLAAALVLSVAGILGGIGLSGRYAVSSTVSLDVNPSIEIRLNRKERVLAVNPLNEDGRTVLGTMDLRNCDLELAVNALIGSMLRNGFLNDDANTVLISVQARNEDQAATLQEKLTADVDEMLASGGFRGAVLSQTVREDASLLDSAAAYDISTGKAQLIRRLLDANSEYTFRDLAALSINELNLLANNELDTVTSVGKASERAFVGSEAAIDAALADAGLTRDKVSALAAEHDLAGGSLAYRVTFTRSGVTYLYRIFAVEGTVASVSRTEADLSGPGGKGGDGTLDDFPTPAETTVRPTGTVRTSTETSASPSSESSDSPETPDTSAPPESGESSPETPDTSAPPETDESSGGTPDTSAPPETDESSGGTPDTSAPPETDESSGGSTDTSAPPETDESSGGSWDSSAPPETDESSGGSSDTSAPPETGESSSDEGAASDEPPETEPSSDASGAGSDTSDPDATGETPAV